jgi:hypothetical protein
MSTDNPAAAWQHLLDQLGEAAAVIEGPLGAKTPRERAEGYRHITRVLSIATEMLLEKGDPARPQFTRWMSPHRKMLGDNPHTIYDAAIVDPSLTYRISGQRGTAAYLGICVYATGADGTRRIVGNLDDVDMGIAEDGAFAVELSSAASADGGAHLELSEDATDIMVRQYFGDPAMEVPATYTIAAEPDAGPPPPLTEELIAARLRTVGAYVRDIVEVEATLSALITSVTPTQLRGGSVFVDAEGNETEPPIDPAVVARVMPTPAIQYAGSWFNGLGDDEVFVVEGTAPQCRYWSIQLLTRWMESGDYAHHPVFLTGRDISVAADGTFRVVIAHQPPDGGDWIATTGLTSANVALRALLADGPLDVRFSREPRR